MILLLTKIVIVMAAVDVAFRSGAGHDSHMEQPPVTNEVFWASLVKQIPEFTDRYRHELDSEDGELLTHLMFSLELVPYVEDLLRTGTDAIRSPSGRSKRRRARRDVDYDDQLARDKTLRRVVACVEAGLSDGDHSLREAILVSFIEDLAKHERAGRLGSGEVARLRALFGANLQAGWESLQRWLDQPYWQDKTAEYRFIHWNPAER